MALSPNKTSIPVAGLSVNIYHLGPLSGPSASSLPVAVIFLLHGRLSSSSNVEFIAHALISHFSAQVEKGIRPTKDLIVVTFDHRNHGSRLLSDVSNNAWSSRPDSHNPQHGVDMYAIQVGTASDVSFLIDFLPSYLYPSGERRIEDWGLIGVSLGGHSTWIGLSKEPRISMGIPIIGCPNYLALLEYRASIFSIELAPPYYPESLEAYVRKNDPSSTAYTASSMSNPFLNKRILVLSGAADKLVPWSASETFVNNLKVGSGIKKVVLEDGAGHEVTAKMVEEASAFVWDWLLERPQQAKI